MDIAYCGTTHTLAQQPITNLLEATLKKADAKLTYLATGSVNQQVAQA